VGLNKLVAHRRPVRHAHGPGAFRHSAAALHRLAGAEAALTELYEFEEALAQYHLYHPTRAELLRAVGQPFEARLVDERTLALANNPAEQWLFRAASRLGLA
jgi:predicted RNA polymerase sigma factor